MSESESQSRSKKIIKSSNTRSVAKLKTAEDGVKRIDLQLSSPVSHRINFEVKGQQIGTLHIGRSF